MKKFTIFGAMLVATMATAQVQVAPEQLEIQQNKTIAIAVKESSTEVFNAETYAKYAQQAAYATADYYYVEGMMHGGQTPMAYGSTPAIMLPGLASLTFQNLYGPTTWHTSAASNDLLAENSETFTAAFGQDYLIGGMYYAPVTTDHEYELNGTTYNIKGYRYASSKSVSVVTYGFTPWTISTGENIPMTLCAMYCDTLGGNNGSDCYMVGNKEAANGKYLYGTNRLVDGVRADTIGQIVRNLSTLKIEQIFINVYNSDYTTGIGMFKEGTSIKVELFNADLSTGEIDMSEPVASTILTEADYQSWGAGYEGMGNLIVRFYEEDIFGELSEVPVYVDGDFYLQITGYNESNCDFGIRSDFYTPVTGTTFYTINGQFVYGASQGGCNLNIGYDAYWPSAIVYKESDILVAPVEGGLAQDGDYTAFGIYTNVGDLENWDIEADEWLQLAVDTTGYSQYGAVTAQINAEAMPTDIEGRQGVVTLDLDGFLVDILVNQGKVESDDTAVENVVAPLFDNKTFNLLGVEVDENYKGIVIKNGQKYIQ
jgi:hypothetical protein